MISPVSGFGGYSVSGSLYAAGMRPGSSQDPKSRPMTQEEKKQAEEAKMSPMQRKKAEREERKRMGLPVKYDPHDPTCECQTCKNRKYKDGSDEMVSFKAAAHISPEAAATRVRAHEQEHVSNAYSKAAQNNGKVIRASVTIHTAICPECGRSYVSGGVTNTQIKYYNEENPYQQDLKAQDHEKYAGRAVDYGV